ncbi:PIG-L deacetylase family protein [Marinobacter sp.]|uniref:PIG-L deacetylase family protein n=1 Tax=Marinobacter sp. TaxID=50741 RepID=UPI0034A1D398
MEQIARARQPAERFPVVTLKAVNQSDLVAISIVALSPMLIASPHPDDETLGCGGLIARCAALGCAVAVLAMTRGEASHPGDTDWQARLGGIREREQRNALKVLGLTDPDIIRLALPDGGLEHLEPEQSSQLRDCILRVMQSRSIRTVFVPAIDDCHADHRMTARLLANVVVDHPVGHFFSYQIWPPEERPPRVSANECKYTHDISDLVALKREAIYQHRSQLGVIDPAHAEGFRMPEVLLKAKLQDAESFALIRDIAAWNECHPRYS